MTAPVPVRSPMKWWTSAAVLQLLAQVNARFPGRDKRSDGVVGDLAHANRASDHNPNPNSKPPWCVRACDIDEDFFGVDGADPGDANLLAAQLVALGPDDPRLAYVIFERVIWRRRNGWRPERYTGANAHLKHIHVSMTSRGDHDGLPFALPILEVPK